MGASVLIVMGVSGVGKTTLAQALAAKFGWDFQEGDALHPPENLRKMAAGRALADADRAPWLARVKAWIDAELAAGRCGLITCSALRRNYRDYLVAGREPVRLLYLEAGAAVLAERMRHRAGHFMPALLLDSQLATLERPDAAERPIVVRMDGALPDSLRNALTAIGEALPVTERS